MIRVAPTYAVTAQFAFAIFKKLWTVINIILGKDIIATRVISRPLNKLSITIKRYIKNNNGPKTKNWDDKKSITLLWLRIISDRFAFEIVWLTVAKSFK